jgi:hypothetical protein
MEPRISLLTFPQRYDGAAVLFNILLVPRLGPAWNGDPLQPLVLNLPNVGDTTPAFADADLQLEARVIDGLDRFPVNAPVDFAKPIPDASGVMPDARALFEELIAPGPGRFQLAPAPAAFAQEPRLEADIPIKKYLPRSYRDAFLFTGPRAPGAVTDDSYHCAIKADTKPNAAFVTTPDTVSWGQIYAYCLRHPVLARRLGLIRTARLVLPDGLLEKGGYLFVDLAAASDYAAQATSDPTLLKRHAARIPALTAGTERPLFAAVNFPVLFDDPMVPGPPPVPGNYDAVFLEAAEYDKGFAAIVHGTQPVSQNLLAEDPDGFTPLTDIGIRLGWDDEQLLTWHNRQLREDSTVPKVPGKPQRLDAPLGVFGYRIDARQPGDAAWTSLVRVRSRAPLTLGAIALGDPGERFEGELGVEVHSMQLDGSNQATGQFWLPSYMAQWNGQSMVLPDENAAAVFKTETADKKAALGKLYEPVGLDTIPLRYGNTYDFRVRLMDLTSGGPLAGDPLDTDQPPRTKTIEFVRHVIPEPVRIANLPKVPDQPMEALFAGNSVEVRRPLLGYPSVVFTGKYANPIPLLQAAATASVGKDSFGIPDPDVTHVKVDVEVRTLRMDNSRSLSGREPYVHLYTTHRDFPADVNDPCVIPLRFENADVLRLGHVTFGDLGVTQAAIDAMDELVLPTARDIRLTMRAVAPENPTYFAPGANIGKPIHVPVRRESTRETNVFVNDGDVNKVRGLYLRPDPPSLIDGTLTPLFFERTTGENPAIIDRMARRIGVDHKGMTLVGPRGRRVVFGCSRRIRHTLAPDHSSLTFAAKEDLINHWIVALTFRLNRDWTWDGIEPVSFEIFRKKQFKSDAGVDDNGGKPVGDWEIVPALPLQAQDGPDRTSTTLIFLDAVEPKSEAPNPADPAEKRFPDIIELDYRVEPRFKEAPAPADDPTELHLSLPVTTPPAQVPKIVSAGIALSKYDRDPKYTQSGARRKFLWLELEEPIRDPNDEYFIRFLGYAPDPLFSDNRFETFAPPEESPLPIDPELVREIGVGHTDDLAGLGAMDFQLEHGDSNRHFLIPLPKGLHADSPELFGFFTYELRVGHAHIWSTAQARWGRRLRATSVQHPAPTLFCTALRTEHELIVEAPYAEAVFGGRNITHDPPRTEIWALLYAQVKQADGKDYRNILLDDRALRVLPRRLERVVNLDGTVTLPIQNRDGVARGVCRWQQGEIFQMLRDLGLPQDSSLSVLCVETMPTLAALRTPPAGATLFVGDSVDGLVSGVHKARSGVNDVQDPAAPGGIRPLSDALGHVRILRTSPLTPVPAVCCPTC